MRPAGHENKALAFAYMAHQLGNIDQTPDLVVLVDEPYPAGLSVSATRDA
jgi:hypothetical protein